MVVVPHVGRNDLGDGIFVNIGVIVSRGPVAKQIYQLERSARRLRDDLIVDLTKTVMDRGGVRFAALAVDQLDILVADPDIALDRGRRDRRCEKELGDTFLEQTQPAEEIASDQVVEIDGGLGFIGKVLKT